MDKQLINVAHEADTFTQNLIEFLREQADDDRYAAELLQQAEALGENARRAIKGSKING